MTIDLYGLKNCDGCRKAQKALLAQDVAATFHDIREPDNTTRVVRWIGQTDDPLAFVNKRSTTWRSLSDEDKSELDVAKAMALLAANPTLIKRPVLRIGSQTQAGYDAKAVAAALGA